MVCHKVDDETKCVSTDEPPTGDFYCANGVDGTHDAHDDSDNDGIKDEHDCDLKEDKPGEPGDKPGEPGDDKPGEPGDDKPGDAKPTELEKYCAENPDAEKCQDKPGEEEPTEKEIYCAEHPDDEKCAEEPPAEDKPTD